MIETQNLTKQFHRLFKTSPRIFRAPGRVNLIGEHTDYNGGFVLPMAIAEEVKIAIAPRRDKKFRVFSTNLNRAAEFDLNESFIKTENWLDHIEGVARILTEKGFDLKGANLVVSSDIPFGAGLSSSAALEIACGMAFCRISGYESDKLLLSKTAQETEHRFIGARVGIMDPFISAYASEETALLLDCRTLEFETVPLDLREHSLVICNTNIKHSLADSAYNMRRAECEQAARILHGSFPEIKQLRDADLSHLEDLKAVFSPLVMKRAKHVVLENERTLEAVACLKNQDLAGFGALMNESHASLRNNFEVSCEELDLMVEIAHSCEGVLGARMTGGGFGGATINLLKKQYLTEFVEQITNRYYEKTSIKPTIINAVAAPGANEINTE